MTAPRRPELRTERLILRRWNDADRDAFAAIKADPAVMEHFPALLDRGQSDDFANRVEATFDACGYGLWADPADNFDHPNTPGWHGRRHVLYGLSAAEWPQYRSPS